MSEPRNRDRVGADRKDMGNGVWSGLSAGLHEVWIPVLVLADGRQGDLGGFVSGSELGQGRGQSIGQATRSWVGSLMPWVCFRSLPVVFLEALGVQIRTVSDSPECRSD
jgi:hypothetical protein